MRIKAVGIDAAMANMGFAIVEIEVLPTAINIQCLDLQLTTTEAEDRKVVRRSSDRLRRGQELRAAMLKACEGCSFAFAEIPSSPQNANAAIAFGLAVGILAGCPIPIIEVSPMEVKAAIAGKRVQKGASKAEIIAWAAQRWPEGPWLRATSKARGKGGVILPAGRLLNDNEHCADAMAAVAAGVGTPEFLRLIQLQSHATTSSPDSRPASSKRVKLLLPL